MAACRSAAVVGAVTRGVAAVPLGWHPAAALLSWFDDDRVSVVVVCRGHAGAPGMSGGHLCTSI